MKISDEEIGFLMHRAIQLHQRGDFVGGMDVFGIYDILEKAHIEKTERDILTDSKIDYDDEIVSIEYVGPCETVDIAVTGDNLFICNDILTKNSMGIVMTLDFFFALISTDELKEMGQVLVKVLKNRGGDVPKFVLGLNRARMTFFDLEGSAQANIVQTVTQNKYVPKPKKEEADVPAFDRARTGRTVSAEDFKF